MTDPDDEDYTPLNIKGDPSFPWTIAVILVVVLPVVMYLLKA